MNTTQDTVRAALFNGNGLAKRLLMALVVFSTLVTTLITVGELYLKYRHDIAQIEQGFSFIEDVYHGSLSESVWVLDANQIQNQLDGLLTLPNVEYLAIVVAGKTEWSAGHRQSVRQITRHVPLTHGVGEQRRVIAELEIVASEDKVFEQLSEDLVRTLLLNGVKTSLVALFMLIIFQLLVTRHLGRLSDYLAQMAHAPQEGFTLKRPGTGRWRPDILDRLVSSVNALMASLHQERDHSSSLTAQLRKNEALFRAIFTQAGTAIVVVDAETLQLLEINDAGCDMLGYTRAEALQLNLSDYQMDFSESVLRELVPIVEASGSGKFISRYRCKDGRVIDIDLTVRPVIVEGRRMLVDVWHDITQQKDTERALASTRDELRLMAESVPVVVYRYQLVDGITPHMIYISPPLERLCGVRAEAAMADMSTLMSAIHPDDRPGFIEADRRAYVTKSSFSYTFRIRMPDGEVRWLMARSVPREEVVHGMVWYGYMQDVTEQYVIEAALRMAQERFRIAFEASPLAVSIARVSDGKLIAVNRNYTRDWGWSEDQLVGRSSLETVWPHRAQRDRWVAMLQRSERLLDFETEFRRHDGTDCPVSISAEITEIDGEQCVLSFVTDITERLRARESERRAASVFNNSLEGIIITDTENRIVDINPAFSVITGYDRADVIGKTPSVLHSGRHTPEFFSEMWKILSETDFWRGEIWNRKKNGDVFPEMLSIAAVRDDKGEINEYIAVFSDISALKEHEEELNRIAHFDALTGLPNRRLLSDRMLLAVARARREGRMLAVCFLDLDGFKAINDGLGHAAGDQVLLSVSRSLSDTLRGGDTLARLGGDEFVMLFGDLHSEAECKLLLQRILDNVAQPIEIANEKVQVSASIGVTLFPDDSGDADTLLRHADQAMYRAKDLGKNRYHFFDPESDKRISAHREALQALELAFARREFVLFYQPKIDLRSGEVFGAEALIRWRKPDGTLVPPALFLPHMEGEDLEIRVSEWVITSAREQLARFYAAGLHVQVSANLVAAHLTQAGFLPWLRSLLGDHPELRPGDFNLEILESAAIGDVDIVARQLEAVRRMGISLSLDDFGTGYSSLAYFRRLPIDTLKIDQGFVRDMLVDASDHNIVESVIRLAEVFQRRVIAEGVETLDHWRELLAMGCDYGQGYGIARPMPAEDFLPWVERWQAEGLWRGVLSESGRDI